MSGRAFRNLSVVVIGVLCGAAVAGAQDKAQAIASTAGGNKFVGSVGCKGCHDQLWNSFYKNPHNKSVV